MNTPAIKKGQMVIAKNGKAYSAMMDSFLDYGVEVVFAQPFNAKTGKPWQAGKKYKVSELKAC